MYLNNYVSQGDNFKNKIIKLNDDIDQENDCATNDINSIISKMSEYCTKNSIEANNLKEQMIK